MNKKDFFQNYFQLMFDEIHSVDTRKLDEVAHMLKGVCEKGKKLIIAGNGGSAAIASHLSVDFTKAAGVRAINFNEADLITCFSNDYGYENWIARALESYADDGDIVLLISSSGSSANIINAAHQARNMGLRIITASGFSHNNPLRELGDINFWVNSSNYNIIENTHQIWLLSIVDYLMESKI